MDRYPHELEVDIRSRDGVLLGLRPICPADAEKLAALHESLTSSTVPARWVPPHPRLPGGEVARLTTVDYPNRLVLVVGDVDTLVAVGRFERLENRGLDGGGEAEVPFPIAAPASC